MVATTTGVRFTQVGESFAEVVPHGMGITDMGDSLRMRWCLDCGQIQGQWPVKRTPLEPPPLKRPHSK